MRILWVLEDADRPGGVESVVRVLDHGLRERGQVSEVLSWRRAPAREASSTWGWLKERVAQAAGRARSARRAAMEVGRRLEEDPSLVAVLDPGSLDVAAHLRGRPRWAVHVHWSPDLILRPWRHLESEGVPAPLRAVAAGRMWWVGRRNRSVLRAAPLVVSLTPSHSGQLEELGARVREIPNPVVFGEAVRDASRRDGRDVRLAFVGRLSPEKDPGLLFDALGLPDGPLDDAVTVTVAGAGPSEQALRDRAGGLPGVTFLGWVDDPWKVLVESDVLVLPSRTEGVPLVLVEALVAGCLVVATEASSGVRDVLRDGRLGRIVPVGDREGLRVALSEAMADVRRSHGPDPAEVAALRARHDLDRVLDEWATVVGAGHLR